jgi:hypothetical protein
VPRDPGSDGFINVGIGFGVEEERGGTSETEVVAEPSRVRVVRGSGGGTTTAPAGGLLPTVVAVFTGRG